MKEIFFFRNDAVKGQHPHILTCSAALAWFLCPFLAYVSKGAASEFNGNMSDHLCRDEHPVLQS